MPKGTLYMDYGLWLLTDDAGQITLTGWSETSSEASPEAPAKTDHWPTYVLCSTPAQLPERLLELGLDLDAGADLADLDKGWDVYLRHPDIAALRTRLDRDRATAAK